MRLIKRRFSDMKRTGNTKLFESLWAIFFESIGTESPPLFVFILTGIPVVSNIGIQTDRYPY